ncbi:MAG TPA: HIT domain-containing protein [Ktedonobacterales bacterium]|nr:HIT domain-containing protein [Ktedonobacterales bacterium]
MSAPDPNCLFCKIIAGTIPSQQVHADDQVIAIEDRNPQAPTHVLVLPRRHVSGAAELNTADAALVGHMVAAANAVAAARGLAATGYRLVINQGTHGGQTVGHLHLHLLGGRQMQWPPG